MRGLLNIYRKYCATAVLLVLVFLVINIAVFTAIVLKAFVADKGSAQPSRLFMNVADEILEKNGNGFRLSQKGQAYVMENDAAFVMLLDKKTGEPLFTWNLPKSLDHSYDLGEAALFARWYLEDYPVRVWDTEKGLLVLGLQKGSQVKYSLVWDREVLMLLLRSLPVALWVNLIALLVVLFIMSRRFKKSLFPIDYGITRLAEGKTADISPKGSVKDLGERINRVSEILERQRENIARRDNARTEWIAGVSHDIRTPLSVILGYAEELSESANLSEKERCQAVIIREQSIRIRSLVEDLNLTSKLAYQMQPLRMRNYRPASLLRRIVTEVLNRGAAGCNEILIDLAPDMEGLELSGDVQLLERAVTNLITNSIGHNEKGCEITVGCARREGRLVIFVADTGKGIPSSVREAVLADKQAPEGVHIMGLRIVRQITASHGGELFISPDGRRTELRLPIK